MITNESIEDEVLNRRIKAVLESDGSFAFRQSARLGRRWLWRAVVPALVAASAALVLCFRATVSAPSDPVRDAILLLSEVEGVDSIEAGGASAAEWLLAWQDAPCQETLSLF